MMQQSFPDYPFDPNRIDIRPGIALFRGLDDRGLDAPLLTPQTTAVMLDVPVAF